MDIDGVGEKLADRFIDLGWIRDLADLYHLDYDDVAGLEGLGEKSAENIRSAIVASKRNPLWRVIHGLGIRHIGDRSAHLLASHFYSLDALGQASAEEIEAVPGIGPTLAASLVDFFSEEPNRDLVRRLGEAGVTVAEEAPDSDGEQPFDGMTLVLTGRLERHTRQEAEGALRALGATVTGSVSKKTTAVIAGEAAGSKAEKARSLDIPVLTEDDLSTMLSGEIPQALGEK
jgi:DNA ligase (NAD+)